MAEPDVKRRLATIVAMDVAGYSRLMGADESGTLVRMKEIRRVIDPIVDAHGGHLVGTAGDGLLLEFASVVEAVTSSVKIQKAVAACNDGLSDPQKMQYRIGINLGDVLTDGDDIYGDGVNIAARLEALAEPGEICISVAVRDSIRDRMNVAVEDIGEVEVKNIRRPVHVFRLTAAESWREKDLRQSKNKNGGQVRRYAAVAALLLAATAGVFWWYQSVRTDVEPASMKRMAFPLPDKPSIAVLPFENLSPEKADAYIAASMTRAITTGLTKVPAIFVISRYSTSRFRGPNVRTKGVAETLGVRHVLRGSVQKNGNRLRVTTQLIDALSGKIVWGETFDRSFDKFFDLQDAVVKKVLSELQVNLTVGDLARHTARKTNNLKSWLLNVQAVTEGYKFTREAMMRSRELNQAAHKADPTWARPLAGIAWTYEQEARRGWSGDRKKSLAIGMEFAQKAIKLDPKDPTGYQILGNLYYLKRDFPKALALKSKALQLAPNNFEAIAGLASLHFRAGDGKSAAKLYDRIKRVSPILPWWVHAGEGISRHLNGQLEKAIAAYDRSLKLNPKRTPTLVLKGATLAEMGRIDEARTIVKKALSYNPHWTIRRQLKVIDFQRSKDVERFRSMFARAGLPE